MKRILCLTLMMTPAGLFAQNESKADPQLAQKALGVLKKHCAACHGPGGTNEGGVGYILDRGELITRKKLWPGDLDKSAKKGMLARMIDNEMPPEDVKARPTAEEITILKEWIAQGAPAWSDSYQRRFVTMQEQFSAVRDFLNRMELQDRKYIRFYTFVHQHNNSRISDREMRLHRAALAKLVNSLSWRAALVVPQVVDAEKTLLAIDIRKLDWDRNNLWHEIIRRYPYGINYKLGNDPDMKKLAHEVYQMTETELPIIRADWFVTTASLPDLYHTLLKLPKTGKELEKELKVDVESNFMRDQLVRAGFSKSGVSGSNRLIERHESSYGAYWKSYDFKANDGKSNLFSNPLGPKFTRNPYNAIAFEHDGGEMIFTLPNGLQGYFLVDGQDKRINEGPIEVVGDSTKVSGTNKIVNGLSCIHCHRHGMITDFQDSMRTGSAAMGLALEKVQRLHPKHEDMMEIIKRDRDRFMQAFDAVCGEFLKDGEDKDKSIFQFTNEPIGNLARTFIRSEVTLEDAALELGLKDAAVLKGVILGNDRLVQIGLGPLANGSSIKREAWDSTARFTSPLQEAASALGIGAPHRVR